MKNKRAIAPPWIKTPEGLKKQNVTTMALLFAKQMVDALPHATMNSKQIKRLFRVAAIECFLKGAKTERWVQRAKRVRHRRTRVNIDCPDATKEEMAEARSRNTTVRWLRYCREQRSESNLKPL